MQKEPSKFEFKSINLARDDKEAAYKKAVFEIDAILKDESYMILKMSTMNCILRENLPYYFWTGFYLVHKGELVVGPYQGSLGCLHIAFGRGVCGTAAKNRETQLVKDVNQFPGHIACDSRSTSEIVVPVFDATNALIAVMDVDSTASDSFDEVDKQYLEQLLHNHFAVEALIK